MLKSHKYCSQSFFVSFTKNEKTDYSYIGKIYMCSILKCFNLLPSKSIKEKAYKLISLPR